MTDPNAYKTDHDLALVQAVWELSVNKMIIALNAGAAIYVAGVGRDLADGVAQARAMLGSGAAARKLDEFVATTQSL